MSPQTPAHAAQGRSTRSSWIAALVKSLVRTDCDERAFLRIEKAWYEGQTEFTTAREQYSAFELLGPPPLGI
jgi:hypothetical protein